MSLRINGLDTNYMYRDVIEVVEQAGDKLDPIMIPKVGTAADVYALDMLVTQIERAKGFSKRIGFELHDRDGARHEEHRRDRGGVAKRIESLHFGVARLCRLDPGAHAPYRRRRAGLRDAHRHREPATRAPLGRSVALCAVAHRRRGARQRAAADRRAVRRFLRPEGFRAAARRVAALGCEGKWAIHPSQVALANEMFTPAAKEVERARRILAAMEEAKREGRGAVTLDGRLIDIASIRQAEALVEEGATRVPARAILLRPCVTFSISKSRSPSSRARSRSCGICPNGGDLNIADEVSRLETKVDRLLRQTYAKLSPWQKVQLARHPDRPHGARLHQPG